MKNAVEERNLNVMFAKAGSGSTSTRITIPKTWIDKLGVTAEEREVVVRFDGERIIIEKTN